MKFLIILLNFFLIQFLTLVRTNPVPTNLAKENFVEFFDKELQTIAEKFCEEAKNLSENFLKNKDINQTLTTEQKELNKSLTDFLNDYDHVQRYGECGAFLIIFLNLIDPEYNNKTQDDTKINTKFQQKLKENFANLFQNYEENYKKFIKEKLLSKYENFKQQLTPEDLNQMPQLNHFIENLKNCSNYQCLPTNLDSLHMAFKSSSDLLVNYIKKDFKKFLIFNFIHINNILKTILNDESKLSQLNVDCRKNLTQDLKEFIKLFENGQDIEKFSELAKEHENVLQKYDNNSQYCSKDRELLKDIFKNYEQFKDKSNYEIVKYHIMKILGAKMMILIFLVPENKLNE